MNTLILKLADIINTPQYGKLPDLVSGLRIALDARTLNLSSGDTVSEWIGTGEGTQSELVFNAKTTGYDYPTFESVDIPAVKFSATNTIKNTNTTVITNANTYVCVVRVDNTNPTVSGISRVFAGERVVTTAGAMRQGVLPFSSSLRQLSGDSSDGVNTGDDYLGEFVSIPEGEWVVGVFTFDGANSKMYLSSNQTFTTSNLNRSTQHSIMLGTSGNVHQNSALEGAIAYFAQYNRVLTDDEIIAVADYHADDFGL